MNIAIIGYGRMGHELEALAGERGHHIVAIIDNEGDWEKYGQRLQEADVALEFSMPSTAPDNILKCFSLGKAVVCGTTGWNDRKEEIIRACSEGKHALFHASNFSLGMNIMFELNKKLAELMHPYKDYRILIEEIHHAGKKDVPSGTAITLANDIISLNSRKQRWINRPAGQAEELEIISVRRNQVPGIHFVKYDSDHDSLEIRHTAHSRQGFAFGALLAAEWIKGKTGFFGMHDLISGHKH
jgi:4-hydroxy-tetrahydrodipicolinate reductase